MVTRTTEVKQLEKLYSLDKSQVVLVYGARGCLKEEVFKNFCGGKKAFYYRGRNVSPEKQLEALIGDVKGLLGLKSDLSSYEECFRTIARGIGSGKKVIVVDDFEYIAKKDDSFIKAIDSLKKEYNDVFVILGASSLSWVNNDIADALGESIGIIDAKMKLDDVGFIDVVRAFPKYSVEQSVTVYGILGGVPSYLNRWNQARSFKENVCMNILNPYGFLFNEVNELLGSELRELTVYNTILASIANGNEKLNDLYKDTGYSRAKISVYIKNLAAFDIVEKVVSFETGGWDNAKKGIYRISNNYVNFYFHFIYPHLSDIYVMPAEAFYDAYIKPDLDDYLQRYFVSVCQEYLELLNKVGQTPLKLVKMGTWLGKTGTIDIIGQDSVRNNVVGMCNWKNAELSLADYEDLVESMKKARISASHVYLFSAKAFDTRLEALAKENESIVLIDMKEL